MAHIPNDDHPMKLCSKALVCPGCMGDGKKDGQPCGMCKLRENDITGPGLIKGCTQAEKCDRCPEA